MKQLGIDGHAFLGMGGLAATAVAGNVDVWLCAATGIATFTYMSLRAAREWVKLKHDLKNDRDTKDDDET